MSAKLDSILPPNLLKTAYKVRRYYKSKKYKVKEAIPVHSTITYKIHLLVEKKYEKIGIEVREKCEIQKPFKHFVEACQAKRVPLKIYFAVPERLNDMETTVSHAQNEELKELGIGLLVICENNIRQDIGTVPCNRRFSLDPGSTLGKYKHLINDIVKDYNLGNYLDAIRDLSEHVEDATTLLCLKAAKKNIINITRQEIESPGFTWEDKINILSAQDYRGANQTRLLDPPNQRDLKSFKDVRNLSDHRKTMQQKKKLEQLYPEKMLQGIRLIREILRINKSI